MKIANRLSLQRQLDVVWDNFRDLVRLEFLDARVFEAVPSGGNFTITHNLGRGHRGYLFIRTLNTYSIRESTSDLNSVTFQYAGGSTQLVRLLLW